MSGYRCNWSHQYKHHRQSHHRIITVQSSAGDIRVSISISIVINDTVTIIINTITALEMHPDKCQRCYHHNLPSKTYDPLELHNPSPWYCYLHTHHRHHHQIERTFNALINQCVAIVIDGVTDFLIAWMNIWISIVAVSILKDMLGRCTAFQYHR